MHALACIFFAKQCSMSHTLLIIRNILFLPPGGIFCLSHMLAISITVIAQSKTFFFKCMFWKQKPK